MNLLFNITNLYNIIFLLENHLTSFYYGNRNIES